MNDFLERVLKVIDLSWITFGAKVGSGLLKINKEASMQLHLANILKNSLELAIYEKDESISIELESGINLGGSLKECDILVKIKKGNVISELPIELKCYRKISPSSGKPRGAQNLFKFYVYEDLELLERYNSVGKLPGIHFTMTDYKSFPFPTSKTGNGWDYDISDGTIINNGIQITTPIANKPRKIVLSKSYKFDWSQKGNFFFLKLMGV